VQTERRRLGCELDHAYGDRVHILENGYLTSVLARLCSPGIEHPEIVFALRRLYEALLVAAVGSEFPRADVEMTTRMAERHPEAGVWRGSVLDHDVRVVVADVIRAGIVPSQVCFEMLTSALPTRCVRLDHVLMARVEDELGHVTGVDLSGSKVGGTAEGVILLLPDPMGATGSTTVGAVEHYRENHGRPAKIVAMHTIVTPEYLRTALDCDPNLVVYALRVDRGLSDPDVLAARPGELWDRERGLDERGYIVPGAGGMGEVLNNSWC
jgi:uracil phosphoribosyltransferase